MSSAAFLDLSSQPRREVRLTVVQSIQPLGGILTISLASGSVLCLGPAVRLDWPSLIVLSGKEWLH